MKSFLKIALLLLLIWFPVSEDNSKKNQDSKNEQPNIVFMIADDWSFPHAGIYGDPIVQTPTFDALASEGALFANAFCAAPSCSPSRAAILSGKYPHQMKEAGNLWSVFSDEHPNWVRTLKMAGYHVGKSRKGWGPGDFQRGGYQHNPAGKDYPDFETFLRDRKEGQPFCYWFGSNDPHREYEANTGVKTGMDPSRVMVPKFLPDTECVRNDILDYYYEVERFDRECGYIIASLEEKGFLENTLVIMTSDNGMPFPRAKANLYDYGTRMPLAIYWKGKIIPGQKVESLINFVDFAPTILEAAGLEVPQALSGKSLMPILERENTGMFRDTVFLERERHANVRKGNLSYPIRAVRTKEYLYIRNFEPGRWPAGDPVTHQSVGQYGDVDNSISKYLIMASENKKSDMNYFGLAFGKRPAEEFYRLSEDPYNVNNLAEDKKYTPVLEKFRAALGDWMKRTQDPRYSDPHTAYWDEVEYTPDYQRADFDLKKELLNYRMLKKEGSNSYKTQGCVN